MVSRQQEFERTSLDWLWVKRPIEKPSNILPALAELDSDTQTWRIGGLVDWWIDVINNPGFALARNLRSARLSAWPFPGSTLTAGCPRASTIARWRRPKLASAVFRALTGGLS